MSNAPSTGACSEDSGVIAGDSWSAGRKNFKDLIVNNYDYEWDQEDFFSKCVDYNNIARAQARSPLDVAAAPWDLGKRLDKYHMMEVAWGSRQAVEITVGDILKKVRAHRWRNAQPQQGARKSKVSDLTYRDLAQLFSEVSLIPAFEIRRNCIVLCLPPLCCIVLHDRVMIHVNNAIQLDSLLLKLEKLTLTYSHKAEETCSYILRFYAPDMALTDSSWDRKLGKGMAARSMLLTEEIVDDTESQTSHARPRYIQSPSELPPLFAGFDKADAEHQLRSIPDQAGSCAVNMTPGTTVTDAISSYQSFPIPPPPLAAGAVASAGAGARPNGKDSDAPWDTLHRVIQSGDINLIQTIPRFVLFPLEFAFLEILISYAFGELNQEVNSLDSRTTTLLTEARSRVYNINLIDSLRDLKLMLHKKVEDISGIQSAFNAILDTPEDMAMMELTRLFYQSGYYYTDYMMPDKSRTTTGTTTTTTTSTTCCPRCHTTCCPRCQNNGRASASASADINPNLEILLEFFSQEINLISTRVKNLLMNLQSAEKHINMIMSFRRNRFAMWDIGCGIVAVGLGIGAVISGTLGMNVPNKQEDNERAFPIYVFVIVISALIAFVIAWLVTNKTYI